MEEKRTIVWKKREMTSRESVVRGTDLGREREKGEND
jgi:hypothetical protein